MSFLFVIPLKSGLKKLIIVFSIIWFLPLLVHSNHSISFLPILIPIVFFLYFWATQYKRLSSKTNIYWIIGSIISVISFTMFTVFDDDYWLYHSLWHILSGISGALILSGEEYETPFYYDPIGARYEGEESSKIWKKVVPDTGHSMFGRENA
jgi:hypothetical protein